MDISDDYSQNNGLKADDWKARWIWKDNEVGINEFAFFRKKVLIDKMVCSAKVFVSAHNHYELFINGVKVSGYVTPAPTHPKKSKYYLCYDITGFLETGWNVFCAYVHYIGGDGQNYVNGLPGFILQCKMDYADGTQELLVSDETWKVCGLTPYRNGTEFQQNRRLSAILDYDARKEDGWLRSLYDDAHWDISCLSRINSEGWVLKPQTIPEGREYEAIIPILAGIQQKGLQVFDAGRIVTGWPRLELTGICGVQIQMRYSEDLEETCRVRHNVCNEESSNYYDLYTMKGNESETYEPCFSYKAFRYVEITGYPVMLKPENIRIVFAGTGLSYEGYFDSSNQLLNNIYHACILTQKNNVVGQMVDCPHREQAQYLADSDLQAETFIYNFSDQNVLKKVLLDFKDSQFDDGTFPFVFPTNIYHPDFNAKIAEWDLHFVTLLWKIYFMYDDKDILKYCYKTAKRTVCYYLNLRDESTGLVPKAEGWQRWNISDHPHDKIDHTGKYLTVQNCLLYHVIGLMSKSASILGFQEDEEEFDKHASMLSECIIKHLYNPVKKWFIDSFGSGESHQGTNVVAYQVGLVPVKDRTEVLQVIVDRGFDCSTLLSLNLLQVLFTNGKGQHAYNLLNQTTFPGWGHMISKGFKTIWEGFNDIESHCHAWNAYPARIFVEYLVGIKATAPGFKTMEIKPFVPSGLLYAQGKVSTISGDVYVGWKVNGNDMSVEVRIPANASARIFLPKFVDHKVTICEQEQVLWSEGVFHKNIKGIIYSDEEEEHVIFEIESGRYLFKMF